MVAVASVEGATAVGSSVVDDDDVLVVVTGVVLVG